MAGEGKGLDWFLLGRYALLVSLCELVPVPLLDGWIEDQLRRRMMRRIARRHGVDLDAEQLSRLADSPWGGCGALLWGLLLWPVKKLVKTIAFVLQAKSITDKFSEVVHRALLVEEAARLGLLPAETARVREAMDAALAHVDTRPIERKLLGTLRSSRHELNRVVWESATIARQRLRDQPGDALADAVEADTIPRASELGEVLTATLRVSGLVPELVNWFHAELGLLKVEPKVAGLIEPQVLPADAEEPPAAAPLALVEDAEEVGGEK